LIYPIYFLILINPYLIIPFVLIPTGLLFYYFIERKNKSDISILWGIFTIIFGLLFLLLLSQLEVQTFREDLKIWRDLSLIIILSGTIYSLILITKGMLSWEKNKT
tara:strand:+ start:858 stop:1175 length:318 start_codon:yes stop_codon:yes gene_type:complete